MLAGSMLAVCRAWVNRQRIWPGERRILRDRWASYRTLVDQLWADDPPEIAEQATRMAAGGLDRDVIFDRLIKDTSIRA
jgi:hypothetical protein